MRTESLKQRAKDTAGAVLFMVGVGALLVAGWLSGCGNWTDPVDPHQAPCGGEPVYYGQYCCDVNGVEWKCNLEHACGYAKDDCREIEPSEKRP